MIQLNLLPAVKEQYIKTERLKRLVFSSSLIAVVVAVAITGFLASIVYGVQKVNLNSLDKSITDNSKKINSIKDLDKILTIQNQLNSLTALHDKKVVASRLFGYLMQVTPNEVSISSIEVAFDAAGNTMLITGTSKSLAATNKFVDTLKFTKYTLDNNPENQTPAFSTVVLSAFGKTEKEASFSITTSYDAALFSQQSKDLKLVIPKQITTQSTTQRPNPLFSQTEGQAN